jgi:cytochrome c
MQLRMKLAILAMALASANAASALAQDKAGLTHAQMIDAGRVLAERLCQNCHVTGPGSTAVVPAGIPTFRGIANAPRQTADRLRSIMLNPHPPMPDVKLSYPEVDQLIAYLDSMRAPSAGPPILQEKDKRSKPDYTDPS